MSDRQTTPPAVTRYSVCDVQDLPIRPDGDYVSYADYHALEEQLAAAHTALDLLWSHQKNIQDNNKGYLGKLFGIDFDLMNRAFLAVEKYFGKYKHFCCTPSKPD